MVLSRISCSNNTVIKLWTIPYEGYVHQLLWVTCQYESNGLGEDATSLVLLSFSKDDDMSPPRITLVSVDDHRKGMTVDAFRITWSSPVTLFLFSGYQARPRNDQLTGTDSQNLLAP